MKLPKLKPVWEWTYGQQVLTSVLIATVLLVGLCTVPAVLGLLVFFAALCGIAWLAVFKFIPGVFFDKF